MQPTDPDDSPALLDSSSLERIVPGELEETGTTGVETLKLHLDRYDFAARQCLGGHVLDIACGVGYGTRRLADQNPSIRCVHGVDISAAAVAFARQHYADSHVSFFRDDARKFFGEERYDTVVSLETIEHISDPASLVRHLAGLVRPGGRLIGSVPTTPSVDGNPHHVTDFTENSFRRLGLAAGLHEIDCFRQVQRFNPQAIAAGTEKRLSRSRGQLVSFYAQHPGKLALRLWATLRYGFANHYITIAWEKPAGCI
jgi:SAM-dependent methyltransferase